MNIVNCTWEFANLGENVCEVLVDLNENIDTLMFVELDKKYTYQVVKVPVGNVSFSFELQNLGYQLIETQLNWKTRLSDFNHNHPLLERFRSVLSFEDIFTENEIQDLMDNIDDNMFSTDRVACDPYYGLKVGKKRYCNWIKSAFSNKASIISFICVDGIRVGFIMFKVGNKKVDGQLGGIFKQYQDSGLGILTCSSIPLYILDRGLDVRTYETATSSNNPANTKLYSSMGFLLNSMKYVFVKHVK